MKLEEITQLLEKQRTDYSLNEHITDSVGQYLKSMNGAAISDMYDMVIAEVEEPLLEAVMQHVKFNQSLAARFLGLSRGTLRKKLERYGMLISGTNRFRMPENINQ